MNYSKAQRLSWFGHADRMANDMVIKNLCEWKPISTRLAGRPKSRRRRRRRRLHTSGLIVLLMPTVK